MMKDYEDTKYEQWRDMAEQVLPALMKKSLLAKVRVFQALVPGHVTGRCEAMAPVVPLRFSLSTLICRITDSTGQRSAGRRGRQKGKRWGQNSVTVRRCWNRAAPPTPRASGLTPSLGSPQW